MSKHNLSIKKIKKQILSINDSIESNFNKLKYFKSNYKKILLSKDNRVFLSGVVVVILTLFYFLVPTIYNKELIQSQIKNQIYKNYNVNIKFNEKINYGLLPRPHFSAKNLSILRNNKEIGISKNLKIYIKISKFFSINKVFTKDLLFYKTDFYINFDDFKFFQNLLKTEPNENSIYFKKSNIFFKNQDDQVLFINKINSSKFYYDAKNLQNVLISKNEVFKIPFKLLLKNDKFNKKIFVKFNSKKIRLDIDSITNYDKNNIRNGLIDVLFINKSTTLDYIIKKNSLEFSSLGSKNFYKGLVDFKPFYLKAEFNYEGVSSKNLFNNDSILIDLIDSEILNNKNLSANLNINIKDITNNNELNNLKFNILIEEGNINFLDSSILWKEDLIIKLTDGSIILDDDGINLIGSIFFDFKNLSSVYSSYQIPKKNRKDIRNINVDFAYNLSSKSIRFDNPRINNKQNIDLEEFLDNFNSKENRIFNKITFKNFLNEFFEIYAG